MVLFLLSASAAGTIKVDLDHASWGMQQGAPADIWDIAQADDGGLWLATGAGLYRFDGQHFQRQVPTDGQAFASSNMTALALQGGTQWIGTYDAGISRLHNGVLHHYGPAEGVPEGMVRRLAYDAAGRLWAAQRSGLLWFDGTRWRPPTEAMGYPGGAADWLLLDRTGRLWVCGAQGLFYLPRGGVRFIDAHVPVSRLSVLAESPTGEVWVADRQFGLMPVANTDGPLSPAQRQARALPMRGPALHSARLHFFHDGSLWGSGRDGGGIFRASFDADQHMQVTHLDADDGLSSNASSPIFEDREGNLWIGTNKGLDRFRAHTLHALPPRAVAAASAETLFRSHDGRVYTYAIDDAPIPLTRTTISLLTRQQRPALPADARAWTAGCLRMERWHGGDAQVAPMPDGMTACDVQAYAFSSEDEGWACASNQRIAHRDIHGWTLAQGLPVRHCSALIAPAPGVVLLGDRDGSVVQVDQHGTRRFGRPEGLSLGPITGLYSDAELMLVAGENGLAVRDPKGHFHQVASSEGEALNGINGIARDRNGHVWLYGIHGLVRVTAASLLRATRSAKPLEDIRSFDATDGLPGPSQQASLTQTLALAADGVLWLSSNQGLAWLDTTAVVRNEVAPSVQIGEVGYAAHKVLLSDGLVLPEGTTQLQINYTATSLARPDRVRYRTRLVGVEDDWNNAGPLTSATYANLGPGAYRFEVQAANEDGLWSPRPAIRRFQIAPTFTQTAVFKLLCLFGIALLLALAMRLRSRQVAASVRARLEERHEERERIARELHDTLLQGTQGLILRLHAASQRLATDDPLRAELARAMDLAEQTVVEGRDRVQGLRTTVLGQLPLGTALLRIRDELAQVDAPDITLVEEGEPRALLPCASEELYLIGREALLNAFRHAQATAIEIEINHGRTALGLRVRDNGIGLPEGALERPGHFGISGMRERASRLGAELQLWSRKDAGTEVQVITPHDRAYLHPPRRWRWPRRAPSPVGVS